MKMKKGLSGLLVLASITLIGLFIVNLIGFVDTETGSALGCGKEWPLCNGSAIPAVWGIHTLIEFSHRGLVGVVTLLLIGTGVWSWIAYSRKHKEVRFLVLLSIGSVFLEAFLGAMGVVFTDPPPILALHFGVSLLAFDGVFLLWVALRRIRHASDIDQNRHNLVSLNADQRLNNWAWFTVVYTYIAMYVGALVASTGDGGVFRGWPFPTEEYSLVHTVLYVDIIHRTLAFGLTLCILRLVVLLYPKRHQWGTLYRSSIVALILVCLQAISGAVLIWTHLAMVAFISHVSFITLLFATISKLAFEMRYSSVEMPECISNYDHVFDSAAPDPS